jgi:hypothetical protein
MEEPPVSSIPHVCFALQTVLTMVATTAAQTSSFIRRQRQLTGASFVQALVFGFLAHPMATLEQLAQRAAVGGSTISPQGLDKRFTQAAAACLHQVLDAAVQQVVAAHPVAISILQRFNGVHLLDSTTITLPDCLATVWQGCGGSPTGSAAALNLQVLLRRTQRVPVRLLAARVPQEVADQRRRRIRKEARDKGRPIRAHVLALADRTSCITTVPQAHLTVAEALVLLRTRWQIELLFTPWKSHGQIDTSRSQQPWRILCEVYAKLLAMVVQHWLVLVSCWAYPDRGLPKAAQTIRSHALVLAAAVAGTATDLHAQVTRIACCVGAGCRSNRRKKRPSTYQLLLALDDNALN